MMFLVKSKISSILLESFEFYRGWNWIKYFKKTTKGIKWKTPKLYDHINKVFSLQYIANVILKITFKNYAIWEDKDLIFLKKDK